MQSFVAGIINNISPTRRNESAGGCRSFPPERNRFCLGRRRSLREGLLPLVPTLHRDYREQNQNSSSSEAKAKRPPIIGRSHRLPGRRCSCHTIFESFPYPL